MNDTDRLLFHALASFQDENDEENCVVLINGRRFKYKNNVVVFDNPKKALAAVRSAIDRYFWSARTCRFTPRDVEDWIQRSVILVPPEDYYRAKRKMRNK